MLGVFIGDNFTEDRLEAVRKKLGFDCVLGSYKIESTGEYLYILRIGSVPLYDLFQPEVFVRGSVYNINGTSGIQVWGVINSAHYYNKGCYPTVYHALRGGNISSEDAMAIDHLIRTL